MQRINDRFALEWTLACHHFVKHDTQTKDIRALVHLLGTSLLRRHVRDRAHDHSRVSLALPSRVQVSRRQFAYAGCVSLLLNDFGKTEIQNLDPVASRRYQIFWFDVAMNDTCLMRGGES